MVSTKTVDHHVSAILRKLDVRTRGEAVARGNAARAAQPNVAHASAPEPERSGSVGGDTYAGAECQSPRCRRAFRSVHHRSQPRTPPALRLLAEPEVERPRSLPKLTPRLEIPPYELSAALRLERELGISHVLAQVLVRRGLTDPREARDVPRSER